MTQYFEKVKNSFFQPFYITRIEKARSFGKENFGNFDLPLILFWFAVIDFYGGLYRIGIGKTKNRNIANKDGFKLFISTFFPSPYNECGEFIYNVFRNGIVHQISPKKAGISTNSNEKKLFWIEIDNKIADPNHNKIAFISIYQLTELTYSGFKKFIEILENPNANYMCQNIYNVLLDKPDGLNDGKILNDEFNKITDKICIIEKGIF